MTKIYRKPRRLYHDANRDGPFSEGDTVTGLVSFNLSKQTKVKSVSVKLKGDGQVHWTEGTLFLFYDYFLSLSLKCLISLTFYAGSVLPQGTNQFMFRLRIPQEDLPSSFKGISGSIVYKVEAQICRKWHLDSTVKKEIQFLSRSIQNTLYLHSDFSVIKTGGTLSAFAKISNGSSKSMKPKFSLLQRIVYIAGGSKNISEKSLCKKVGDAIKPNSEETVSCTIDVPPDAIYTLNNCDLISVEYYLKVCNYPPVLHTFLFTLGFLSIQLFIKVLPYEMLITTKVDSSMSTLLESYLSFCFHSNFF
uniref:Arrestin domain-containing protein 3-like n=1 Tax=Poecilia reticulata TaxID=8081 RepID=A0A3P9NC74_POERE